jgi:hypothetical protein
MREQEGLGMWRIDSQLQQQIKLRENRGEEGQTTGSGLRDSGRQSRDALQEARETGRNSNLERTEQVHVLKIGIVDHED